MQPHQPPPPPPGDHTVLAVVCTAGHANPPQRPTCRICGGTLDGSPQRVARPALGRVIASSGVRIELDAPVIVGRQPRAARFQGTEVPHLLTLPEQHVSATHLALRLEGWSVLAVDLNSTNGTFLRRNGQRPSRMTERPTVLVPGDVIDLGHGVHLRFEELP